MVLTLLNMLNALRRSSYTVLDEMRDRCGSVRRDTYCIGFHEGCWMEFVRN